MRGSTAGRWVRAVAVVASTAVVVQLAPGQAGAATQAPYKRTFALPTTIQVEDYDKGGQGVAYADTETTNKGGAYRTTEGVDVQTATDPTGGAFAIGYTRPGEWVEYTVDVPTAGSYDLGLRWASGSAGGTVKVQLGGGTPVTYTLTNSGSWNTWKTTWATAVPLAAGKGQVLRISFGGVAGRDIANLNWLEVRASGTGSTTTTTSSSTTTSTTTTTTTTTSPSTTTTSTTVPDTTTTTSTSTTVPDTATTTSTTAPDDSSTTTSSTSTSTTSTTEPPSSTSSTSSTSTTSTTVPAEKPVTWPTSFTTGTSAPAARFEATTVTIGGTIYVFGGFVGTDQKVVRTYLAYDVAANRWRTIGTLPEGMAETHLGAATDGHDIWFAGGLGGDVQPADPQQWASDEVWRYTPSTDTWALVAHLPTHRAAGGLALVGRTLHYVGGVLDDEVTNTASHVTYDLDAHEWGTAADLPVAKDHFSTIVVGGKIYVLGGEKGHHTLHQPQTSAHVYDPATGTWKQLASMPIGKSHLEGATFLSNGRIVMAGGQVDWYAPTANVVAYDPAVNSWATLPSLPAQRQGATVQRVGNTVVVALGAIQPRDPQSRVWRGSL